MTEFRASEAAMIRDSIENMGGEAPALLGKHASPHTSSQIEKIGGELKMKLEQVQVQLGANKGSCKDKQSQLKNRLTYILAELEKLMENFIKISSGEDQRDKNIIAHMRNVITTVRNIFERRLWKMEGKEYAGIETKLNEDVLNKIFSKVHVEWLQTVSRIGGFQKDWPQQNHKELWELKNCWNDLMIEILVDVQSHELIPMEEIYSFLNHLDEGRIVSNYICNRFYGYGLVPAYINFDMSLESRLESHPVTKRMGKIFQLINKETWKKIEVAYLIFCIESNKTFLQMSTDFIQIGLEFTEITSWSPQKKKLPNEIQLFFQKLVNHLLGLKHKENFHSFKTEEVIEFKFYYEMLYILINYFRQGLSDDYLKMIGNSEMFNKLEGFENMLRLISSYVNVFEVSSIELAKYTHILLEEKKSSWFSLLKRLAGFKGVEYPKEWFEIMDGTYYLGLCEWKKKPSRNFVTNIISNKFKGKIHEALILPPGENDTLGSSRIQRILPKTSKEIEESIKETEIYIGRCKYILESWKSNTVLENCEFQFFLSNLWSTGKWLFAVHERYLIKTIMMHKKFYKISPEFFNEFQFLMA